MPRTHQRMCCPFPPVPLSSSIQRISRVYDGEARHSFVGRFYVVTECVCRSYNEIVENNKRAFLFRDVA